MILKYIEEKEKKQSDYAKVVLEGTNIVPNYPGLVDLGIIREEQNSIDGFLTILNSMVGADDSWPPYYTNVINGDLNDNANRIYLTLKVGMHVANISESGSLTLDHIQYSKESKIFGNNKLPITIAPTVECAH